MTRVGATVAVALAAAYLWLLAYLALWVLAPLLVVGWQPVLVDAASMAPAIAPGDVVLVDTAIDAAPPAVGDVVTYADPVWPGEHVTHRILAIHDGLLRTKGDASAVADSTPIDPDDVLGRGVLVIPYVGLPLLWAQQAPPAAAAWTVATVLAWVLVSRLHVGDQGRRRRRGRPLTARPIAHPLRRWTPLVVVTGAVLALAPDLGALTLLPPAAVLLVDPRGPHVPFGRWARRWTAGRLTRRLRPMPSGAVAVVATIVATTITSSAVFTGASANTVNQFGAADLQPVSDLSAVVTCSGASPTVTLSWTPSGSPPVEGYTVRRDGSPIATVTPGGATGHTDIGATNGATHSYTVQGYLGSWVSPTAGTAASPSCATAAPSGSSGVVAESGSSNEYLLTVPAGTQEGDLLLSVLVSDDPQDTVAPAGWSSWTYLTDTNAYMWIDYRIATAGDAGTTYTFTADGASDGAAALFVYSGVDTAQPLEGLSAQPLSGTTHTLPAVSATRDGSRLFAAYGSKPTTAAYTPAPGMTRLAEGTGVDHRLMAADELLPTGGSTGPRTATTSGSVDHAWGAMLVIRPDDGGFAMLRSASTISAAMPTAGSLASVAGTNGQLPDAALVDIGPGHRLAPGPAAAYLAMRAAALDELGVDLSARLTDSYRPLDVQVRLAQEKGLYSQGGLAAVPGTSPHGWGRAVDLDVSGSVHAWLTANASRFGFHTIPREPWHWEHDG